MRTLKEHILEKLKVSAKDDVVMTNEDFFNLLLEYTNTANIYALITSKAYNKGNSNMPLYSEDITRYISTIKPYIGGHKQIVIELRDVYEAKCRGYIEIDIEKDGDQIVSFTSEDWLLSMIKYMQDIINSK